MWLYNNKWIEIKQQYNNSCDNHNKSGRIKNSCVIEKKSSSSWWKEEEVKKKERKKNTKNREYNLNWLNVDLVIVWCDFKATTTATTLCICVCQMDNKRFVLIMQIDFKWLIDKIIELSLSFCMVCIYPHINVCC